MLDCQTEKDAMLRTRGEIILNSIIRQYVEKALPVSSGSVLDECGLDVSSATIRSEVARLELEGYIQRPHYASGSIPSDKGYRYFVSSLKPAELPLEEQFLINHLFHQVEDRLEEWLNLAVSVLSQRVKNVVVVTAPRSVTSRFKHVEMVSIQPTLVLMVLVLQGAKVRQQLINFEDAVSQQELAGSAAKLNQLFASLSHQQITARLAELDAGERRLAERILHLMAAEDNRTGQDVFLEGWHFLLNQPEFSHGQKLAALIDLAEQKKLANMVMPTASRGYGVEVVIGGENKAEHIQDCSIIASRYGLPGEPLGSIAVVGPTRMDYDRTMAVTGYVASIISLLVAELYGLTPEAPAESGN
jgi:heat-inducible transcriptional repressor